MYVMFTASSREDKLKTLEGCSGRTCESYLHMNCGIGSLNDVLYIPSSQTPFKDD